MTLKIDSHCHIYPRKIARKALASVGHFYDGLLEGERVSHLAPGAGDAHSAGAEALKWDGTPETLLAAGKAYGISHFIVHSVATRPSQTENINRFIASSVRMSGKAFTGLGTLHPDSETLEDDLDRLQFFGLKGVKLHPDTQLFHADDPKACRIYELCEARALPVLIHAGDYRYDYSGPKRIANVLRTFPKLKLIAAHLGGWSQWDEAVRILPDFPNVTVDTSSSFQFLSVERALEIIRAYGAERVMFGTDYPFWTPDHDLACMEKLGLSPEELEMIFWKNCAGMYGIML